MPMHSMTLPQAIWARSGLPSRVQCAGDTVADALQDCCRRLPQLALYLQDPGPGGSNAVGIFAGGQRVRRLDQVLTDPTELRIIIPSAGG